MKYFNKKWVLASESYESVYKPMLQQMAIEVEMFFENFLDDPQKVSQWGHHYFCKDDGGVLKFDLSKPHHHECTICHKIYESALYDGVWVYNYRNQVAVNVWKSAVLFDMSKEPKYLKYIQNMIHFYAKRYAEFKPHNKEGLVYEDVNQAEWGCGKIMPQGLNESIFMIRLINGLEIVKHKLTMEDKQYIHQMIEQAEALITPQVNKIHNISCWYDSALTVMGLFTGNQALVEKALYGEYGIEQQLLRGVTSDYFWFEGSIHYNFFTLEGMMNSLIFADTYGYVVKPTIKKTIKHMLINAYEYAFNNHTLPNPNDGWPNINLKTYGYIYDMATRIFKSNGLIANINRNISNGILDRVELPLSKPYYFGDTSLERLTLIPHVSMVLNRKIQVKAHNFKTSQYAIIRKNNINVFLKYGHNGPSHAHPDKMSIEVLMGQALLTRDLSNAGYGSSLCNQWHRMSPSHSTVVINGQSQISMRSGETLAYRKNYIKATTKDVYRDTTVDIPKMLQSMNTDEIIKYLMGYLSCSKAVALETIRHQQDLNETVMRAANQLPKVDYTRTIKITENGFTDRFLVESDRKVNMDYFFHGDFKMLTTLPFEPSTLGYQSNGYEHIQAVEKLITNDRIIKIDWVKDHLTVKSTILLEKGCELYRMKTLDNPVNNLRDTLMIRKKSKRAVFKINWEMKEN